MRENCLLLKAFIPFLLIILLLQACNNSETKTSESTSNEIAYDMRDGLSPSRLTIAMWDFSWLYMHYQGGAFGDFNKVTDELLERGFNTVRIDAFPLIIGKLDSLNQKITIKGDSLRNWGASDKDRKHTIVTELVEFMTITKEKGISVILSSWGQGAVEHPNIRNDYTDREQFWKAWEKVINLLDDKDLLDHVVYVDFDQEFPYFSPFDRELNRLGKEKTKTITSDSQAMEAAGRATVNYSNLNWNPAQMDFVRNYFNGTLYHFQRQYPQLRFTFSFTGFWREIRAMQLKTMDVLELHFFMNGMDRYNNRSNFGGLKKDRGEHDYKDYMIRIDGIMQSVRPMLMKEMHNQLAYAKEWSEEIAAPLVTTEAWGPWWHMDHSDLEWKWLYDWCEDGMQLSTDYELWGTTPWNYSHPYWENWEKVEWYQKVNGGFLEN